MMMLNLPPQRTGKYSPLGQARGDYPEMTDDDYVRHLCEQAVVRRSPAAGI
jgi:hypothetical protein